MAFTTEFVMGAGGSVEEYPLSTPVTGTWTTVLTVTPPGRSLVVVTGAASGVSGSRYVLLRIGGQASGQFGTGPAAHTAIVEASTAIEVYYNYSFTDAQFTGTVYVVPLP